LVGGFFATAGHIAAQPTSIVPVVGASGAIAAVMGAYLVLYPRVRIRTLLFFFIPARVQARWLLLFWFIEQFFVSPSSGVAWVAHVAGFIFGAFVALFWRNKTPAVPEYAY
jgi:membrane associated rhomboid family serine protease